jgi:acetyl-CoA synthetase
MRILDRILERTDFNSYEDFKKNYRIKDIENFRFVRDVVDVYAQETPEKRALEWLNDQGDERTFTFGDMSRLSKQAANFLSGLGITKGDKVMVILKRRWEYWVCALALHRIGAVLIPASAQLTTKDILYRLEAADVKMLIAVNDDWVTAQCNAAIEERPDVLRVMVNGAREGWTCFASGIEKALAEFTSPELDYTDMMVIYFTSGTTGMPKLAMHDQRYPLGHMVTAAYWQRVVDDGLHLTASDSGWAKFGWGCLYGQWIAGSAILGYDIDKFDAKSMLDVIGKCKPTTVCVPPTIYRFMLKVGIDKESFASVTRCTTAGEPLSPEVNKEFVEKTGLTICEGMGQSEGSVLIANYPFFEPRMGSMGKFSPLYDLAIVDESGEPCPVGEEGEIVIRTLERFHPPGLTRGYWRDGGLDDSCASVYHTGDIAYMDEDGYCWYIGRNDDVIKCSGYRIGPFEIETVLNTHQAVHECAIIGVPDPLRGQVVCAAVVLAESYSPSDELTKELQDYVKHLTAPYKYPRVIRYLESLPKTISGKISRTLIRAGV